MDAWAYAVVDNSQKRGTGNRKRGTGNLGTPMPRGKDGNRERGTGNWDGERATGNLGTPAVVKKGGNRSYECGVQSPECRIRYYKRGAEGRGTRGEGQGNCQNGRRRPTAGKRGSGFGVRESWLVARRSWPVARRSWLAARRSCLPRRARPGQKKKAVQKVQAPAQPFVAFDPARPADDQSVCRAHRVFNCTLIDLYGWCCPDATPERKCIGKGRIHRT